MQLEQLMQGLSPYRGICQTPTKLFTWQPFTYENDYMKVVRLASNNKNGCKQWSIKMEIKKGFEGLNNWKLLKDALGSDLAITPVRRGKDAGLDAIRLDGMSVEPVKAVAEQILDFIFS